MGPVWLRLTVMVVFIAAWCAPFYLEAAAVDDRSTDDEGWGAIAFLVLYGGLTLATGFIARWPALLLPAVVYVLLTPLGANPEDSDLWSYAGLYLLPVGFLSFFVLLLGWLFRLLLDAWQRRRGREPPRSTADALRVMGEEGSLRFVPLALTGIVAALVIALILSASTTQVKAANVSVENAPGEPPDSTDTRLRLKAVGVDGCSSGDDRVTDLEVEESPAEVVVTVSVEIHREFPCNRTQVTMPFAVTLRNPLRDRAVVDGSGGTSSVIWTAETRERFQRLSPAVVERFLLARRPATEVSCKRVNPHYFDCRYRRPGADRRSFTIVRVRPTGELELWGK